MKLKKTAISVAIACASLLSTSAHAYFIQDAWSMNDGANPVYTGIGHLSLNGGIATVNQQVGIDGNPFVGASFVEFGQVFSLNLIPENLQGFNDAGLGDNLVTPLKVEFVGLAGVVTAYNSSTGKINYSFVSDVGSIILSRLVNKNGPGDADDTYTSLATLSNFGPSGGDLGDFFGVNQTAGQSTLLLNFKTFLNGFDLGLTDPYALGIPTSYADPEDLFLQVQTNNKIGVNPSAVGECAFNQALSCRTLVVTSDGSADLLRVPEPGSLALLGLGLFGLGAIRRRK